MQEMQASGTSPNEAEMSQRVIAKLRARQNEYSNAMKEDCIRDYGTTSQKQCQCFINKVDYSAHLARMEKALNADPKLRAAEVEKAQQLRQEQEMAAIKACDLSIAPNREAQKHPARQTCSLKLSSANYFSKQNPPKHRANHCQKHNCPKCLPTNCIHIWPISNRPVKKTASAHSAATKRANANALPTNSITKPNFPWS